MKRKSLSEIVDKIRSVLQEEDDLSVRQISIKIKSEWKTVDKALDMMKSLKVVKERANTATKRKERLFRLNK